MNNKQTIFNKKVYVEGLKQLKIPFVFFGIILGLYSVFCPLSNTDTPLTVSGQNINPLFYFCFLIIVPIMTHVLFNFLNKRNSSDFYHSIPIRRTTLMFSYSLSIITSTIIIIVGNFIVFSVLSKILCSEFSINESSYIFMLNILIASLYIHACILLAKSVTGTMLSNILLTLMIIFVPRLCIYVVADTIYSLNFMTMDMPVLLSPDCNLVVGILSDGLKLFWGAENTMLSIGSGIYTLIIGIIYYSLALWQFNTRKSETASSYAPNKVLSAIYRILLTYWVTLVPLNIIIKELPSSLFDEDSLLVIVLFYAFALITYYGYEAIATKSIKKSLKTSKGLLAVGALNILTIVISIIGVFSAKSFQPKANEIDSVSLVRYYSYTNTYYYSTVDYYDYVKLNTNITDETILEYVSSQLKEQVKDYTEWEDYYKKDVCPYYTIIRHNGKEYKRKIYFPQNMLEEYTIDNGYSEELLDNFCNLPDYPGSLNTNIVVEDSSSFFVSSQELSSKDAKKLYNSIKDEIENCPKNKVFDEIIVGNNNNSTVNYSSPKSVRIKLKLDNRPISLDIDIAKLPESYKLLE